MEPAGDVFKALADPTRRAILDLLFESDGRTLVDLCGHFPELTRFGVMKHLSVLEAADLVLTERSGRVKRHYLNPVPIERVANRWISRYAARFTTALIGLDAHVGLDARVGLDTHVSLDTHVRRAPQGDPEETTPDDDAEPGRQSS